MQVIFLHNGGYIYAVRRIKKRGFGSCCGFVKIRLGYFDRRECEWAG
jgi:hypothetical protein